MVFSTNLFAIKLGIAIGGASVGWILAYSGYVGGATTQTPEAITAINLLFTIIPGVMYASLSIIMMFYTLDNEQLVKIKALLALDAKKNEGIKPLVHNVELN
jgi:Na+/melibiose symporter-like transporter